jgi:hypothetical protein
MGVGKGRNKGCMCYKEMVMKIGHFIVPGFKGISPLGGEISSDDTVIWRGFAFICFSVGSILSFYYFSCSMLWRT